MRATTSASAASNCVVESSQPLGGAHAGQQRQVSGRVGEASTDRGQLLVEHGDAGAAVDERRARRHQVVVAED